MSRDTKGDCQRCNEFIGYFGSTSSKLVGGYHAHICADCLNDWDVFIREHPAFLAFYDGEAAINMLYARTSGDGIDRLGEVSELNQAQRERQTELFNLAERWVAEPISRKVTHKK